MYMLPTDITNSFIDGSVKFSIGSEVSQMSCTLLNIKGALLNRYHGHFARNTVTLLSTVRELKTLGSRTDMW